MPASKRKIRPTYKAVAPTSPPPKKARSSQPSQAAKRRSRASNAPDVVNEDSIRDAESPPPSSPPPKPVPVHYIVAFTAKFESEVLVRSSKAGHTDGEGLRFRPRIYITEVIELARIKAEREGLTTYLYTSNITIHPLDRKARPPIIIDWKTNFEGSVWDLEVEPVIRLVAGEAKRGQSATVSIDIETVFSRYRNRLPESTLPDPPQLPPASTPARATQTARKKRKGTTTERMLAESKERDELTSRDNMNMLPLITQWTCKYSQCPQYPRQGHCYVEDGQHYRIAHWMWKEWQDAIYAGQTDILHMPASLRERCVPAAKARPWKSATPASTPNAQFPQQPWSPYSYMMAPTAPPYMPLGYYSPQQAAPQQQQQPNLPLHPQPTPQPPGALPPASSPPGQPDTDPDELIQGYFDHLIKKYPHQRAALGRAQNLLHEEAFDVEDLWTWLIEPAQHPRLAEVPPGLRKRIKTHLKEYLQHPAPPRPQRQQTHVPTAPTRSPFPAEIDLTQTDQSSERPDFKNENDELDKQIDE